MRSFIITVILFICVCSIIALNNLYIISTADRITSLVNDENFNIDPEGTIDTLDELWQKHHPYVGLSVGYKELDRMSDLILDLKAYYEAGNTAEVRRIRMMIAEAANEISRLEHLNVENLF